MRDMTYKEALKAVKHLKAIGETSIWLRGDSEKPWQHVTKVEGGGSHRLDMNTSIWFEAVEPKTGLSFRWRFEIEPMEANGKGHYEINATACRAVMGKLEGKARKMFSDYLATCAAKVRSKGEEWKRITDRQFRDAETLEQLAASR